MSSKSNFKLHSDPHLISEMISILHKTYPTADCTLNFDSAWGLLLGGIIGAQCTDERVNMITPLFLERFPAIADVSTAEIEEIETLIKRCGIYRNKAKAIKGSAIMIMKKFDGQVPDNEEDLLKLPGVGRKIANLILSDYYGQPAIVVDTHCGRISRLLGLTGSKDPVKIEEELQLLLPKEEWISWGHLMVAHGRTICQARCRKCGKCSLNNICAYGIQIEFDYKNEDDTDDKECY